MTLVEHIEEMKKERNMQNVLEVMENSEQYIPKIEKYIEDHWSYYSQNFTTVKEGVDYLAEKVKSDYTLASIFSKEASRQNLIETLIFEYIRDNKAENISEVIQHPAGGKNSLRFDNEGNFVPNGVKSPDSTKSVDFELIMVNGTRIYITQKYTKEEGGAQDNQYKDVIEFLNKGSKKEYVMAVVDGAYWDKRRGDLKEHYMNNPKVYVCSADDLVAK